ncbi:hypothetical protein OLX02_01720 [Novosphingobium sp. KCTC 2891]|uniref:hypothetical protein n=1 Tax=Novosphingobium sp. KCTC 2891 TaxID=2989730 RepID=UPI0022235309|nr:hypothetical protein [Novosphingobium sp. KCTC 2891]MCW1381531.1 hypothetical protein [Novosphingobium sp. KCTC 2891]
MGSVWVKTCASVMAGASFMGAACLAYIAQGTGNGGVEEALENRAEARRNEAAINCLAMLERAEAAQERLIDWEMSKEANILANARRGEGAAVRR